MPFLGVGMGGAAALIEAVRGDLTRTAGVDAIVNAANSSLMGGGGVDGAIHRAGGPEVLEACRLLRSRQWPEGLPAGEAALTTGGRLPFRVIHTVGPVWRGGHEGEPETLARCYRRCIALAAREGLPRLAFPSISTGAYGYPVALAAPTAVRAVRAALAEHPQVSLVRFVLFSESDLRVYEEALRA